MSICPCCTGKNFEDCCQPVIENQSASTAVDLMRSRYAAYSIGDAHYLLETTHPETRTQHHLQDIENWSKENKWTKLEIIKTEKGTAIDQEGIVAFKAYFQDKKGINQIHYEKSYFRKENQSWYYVEGNINPVAESTKTLRNHPCPCGSGKKYKKCCA